MIECRLWRQLVDWVQTGDWMQVMASDSGLGTDRWLSAGYGVRYWAGYRLVIECRLWRQILDWVQTGDWVQVMASDSGLVQTGDWMHVMASHSGLVTDWWLSAGYGVRYWAGYRLVTECRLWCHDSGLSTDWWLSVGYGVMIVDWVQTGHYHLILRISWPNRIAQFHYSIQRQQDRLYV